MKFRTDAGNTLVLTDNFTEAAQAVVASSKVTCFFNYISNGGLASSV